MIKDDYYRLKQAGWHSIITMGVYLWKHPTTGEIYTASDALKIVEGR